MDNKEAIKALEVLDGGRLREAVNEAIKALEALDAAGDTISRDAALKACYKGWNKDYKEIAQDIKDLPPAHPEIIRCRKCRYKERKGVDYYCDHITGEEIMVSPNDYCSWADRES